MGDGRFEFDDAATSVEGVGNPAQDTCVAKLLYQSQRAAHRDARCDAQRTDREILALAFVDEEIDEHLPGRISEQFRRTYQLLPEEAAMRGDFRILQGDAVISNPRSGSSQCERSRCWHRSRKRVSPDDVMRVGCGHDDMIDDLDIERSADLIEMSRRDDIFLAWRRIAARVIVNEDEARCIMLQRAAENRPRIYGELAQSSLLQSLVRDQPSRIVEKQDPQRFVVERTH